MENIRKAIEVYLVPIRQKGRALLASVRQRYGREQSVIGIDIGVSAVKAVQITGAGGEATIIKSALVDITDVSNDQKGAVTALTAALAGMKTKGAKVVVIVNCPQTCTRKIIAPHMPKKELIQAVHWEAKNAIPFSIDEALMDFEVLGEVSEKGVKKLIVAVAAAPKETVRRHLRIISGAGLKASAMIPISLGLQNLIGTSKEDKGITVAVVEMGAAITELNIYCEGRLAFSRKLPLAGGDITKSMTSTLMTAQGKVALTLQEAEQIKKDQGIPGAVSEELVAGKILPSQIVSLVRPCVEQLAGEIERSFDFYREESHGGRVQKIILFGGAAGLKGLAEFLRKELDLDVEIGNSLDHLKALPGAVSHASAGSRFDLALGAALNRVEKINLLPIELKEEKRRFVANVSLEIAAAGILASLMLCYIGMRVQLIGMNKSMSALMLEQKSLGPQLESLRAKMSAGEILAEKPYWEDALKEISNVIPPRVYLTRLSMSQDVVRLQGDILQGEQDAQTILSGFMLTLEEGIFRNVSLVTTQKKQGGGQGVFEFEISCSIEDR